MDEIWEGGVGEKKVSGRILGLRLVGLHQAPPKFVLLLPSTPSTCNKHVKYNLPNRSLCTERTKVNAYPLLLVETLNTPELD